MLGHRELTIEDYVEILKRRVWVILICAVSLCVAGGVLSFVVQARYVSQTLVLIEQQVPQELVKPVIAEDLQHHLDSMREQILSRSRLQPIIQRFNLFSTNNYSMDDRIELTQQAIGIRPIPSTRGGMPGFYITYRASDPHTAQQVCGAITSLFLAENARQREQSAVETTDFLRQQLGDSKQKLDEQDARLTAFQQQHFGMLPDQRSSNSDTLQALTTQMNAVTETLNRLQQNETFLQTMIAQQARTQHTTLNTGVAPDQARKQLQDLMEQKRSLEATYTPNYPDVIAISHKIEDLQAAIARKPGPAAPAVVAEVLPDAPEVQQLKAQLRVAQRSIADEKQEQKALEQQIRTYEARIESTPRVDQEYKQLTRDHEAALQFYNSLLARMNESSMATALEQHQQGEQLRVLDAPNLPESPNFPNHMAFAGAGLAGGLFLGLVLAGLLEYLDPSLRNEKDIWAFTKLPTLATISRVRELNRQQNTMRPRNPLERLAQPVQHAND